MRIKKRKFIIIVVVITILLIITVFLFINISFKNKIVESGDTIRVEYTGTLEDGTQFDSSVGRSPLEFTAGSGQTIPAQPTPCPTPQASTQPA